MEQLLDTNNPAPFCTLLQQVQDPANAVREPAEQQFWACIDTDPVKTVTQMMILLAVPDQATRAISAVLLRRALFAERPKPDGQPVTAWEGFPANIQNEVKAKLLEYLNSEQTESVNTHIRHIVCTIACYLIEQTEDDKVAWPELLHTIFQWVQTDNKLQVVCALEIFVDLAPSLVPTILNSIDLFHQLLFAKMQQNQPLEVRSSAFQAAAVFICSMEQFAEMQDEDDPASKQLEKRCKQACMSLVPLVPLMMSSLHDILQHDETAADLMLEKLVDIATEHPRFMRNHLATGQTPVLPLMIFIAESATLEETSRSLAIEFVLTLAENQKAPGMIRKQTESVKRLFKCLLEILAEDIDEDEAWHTTDDDDDEDESILYDTASHGMDRLAIAIGAKTILPIAMESIQAYFSNPDWKRRHAGLRTLTQIAEGCNKLMIKEQNLIAVVDVCLGLCQDTNPRVRYAAVHAIGQMCTDLRPHIQQIRGEKILQVLVHFMRDGSHKRVQAHACSAIVNYADDGEKDPVLKQYMDQIIEILIEILRGGRAAPLVVEKALTALASVADCAGEGFIKYYDHAMPVLEAILENVKAMPLGTGANVRTIQQLRAKSLECITLVGMNVGKEKFHEAAERIMVLVHQLQQSEMDQNDPTVSYMQQASARICKCMGKEFQPYLPSVMVPLMRSAKIDNYQKTISNHDLNEDDEDGKWETYGMVSETESLQVNSSLLEEKATACEMIIVYAEELKEGFYPYVEPVMELFQGLVNFPFNDEIREAAISVMPLLVNDAMLAFLAQQTQPQHGEAWVKSLFSGVLERLVKAVHMEHRNSAYVHMNPNEGPTILTSIIESIHKLVTDSSEVIENDPAMKGSHMSVIGNTLHSVMTNSMKRTEERKKKMQSEDFDEEEQETLDAELEQETELFDQVAECINACLKKFKTAFLPVLQETKMLEVVKQMMNGSQEDRRVAICIVDDIVDYASEEGAFLQCFPGFFEGFMPDLIAGCDDENDDVRQAAAYGLGVCAEKGGETWSQWVPHAMEKLIAQVSHPEARSNDREMATDNAISALGKMCEFRGNLFDAGQVFPHWLNYLPVKGDEEEARTVHESLVRMVENPNSGLLGPQNPHLPQIALVLAKVIGTDLVNDELNNRIRAILTQIPQEFQTTAWGKLTPEEQQHLQQQLQPQAQA